MTATSFDTTVPPQGSGPTPVVVTLTNGESASLSFPIETFSLTSFSPVSALAFSDPVYTAGSKLGILSGSFVATVVGVVILSRTLPR